jgi:hypothetical protein
LKIQRWIGNIEQAQQSAQGEENDEEDEPVCGAEGKRGLHEEMFRVPLSINQKREL